MPMKRKPCQWPGAYSSTSIAGSREFSLVGHPLLHGTPLSTPPLFRNLYGQKKKYAKDTDTDTDTTKAKAKAKAKKRIWLLCEVKTVKAWTRSHGARGWNNGPRDGQDLWVSVGVRYYCLLPFYLEERYLFIITFKSWEMIKLSA